MVWKGYGLGMDEQTELSALLREAVTRRDVTLLHQGVALSRSLGQPVATLLVAEIRRPTDVGRLWWAKPNLRLTHATCHRLHADLAARALSLFSEAPQAPHPALYLGLRQLVQVSPETSTGPISKELAQRLKEAMVSSQERTLMRGVWRALDRGADAKGTMLVGLHKLMLGVAEDPEAEVAWLKRRLVDALLEGL